MKGERQARIIARIPVRMREIAGLEPGLGPLDSMSTSHALRYDGAVGLRSTGQVGTPVPTRADELRARSLARDEKRGSRDDKMAGAAASYNPAIA